MRTPRELKILRKESRKERKEKRQRRIEKSSASPVTFDLRLKTPDSALHCQLTLNFIGATVAFASSL